MVRIGVIAERTTKRPKYSFPVFEKEVIYNEKNPFGLAVVTIPYTAEQAEKKSGRRLEKILKKADELLLELGAERAVLTRGLKALAGERGARWETERNKIFLKNAPECVRRIADYCGIDLLNCKVCIRDDKWDRITEYLMAELCYDIRKLAVCTSNTAAAARACDDFFERTGFLVTVLPADGCADAEVEIDVGLPSVRVGRDLIVDGMEPDLDLGGCDVDFLEIAACAEDCRVSDRISSYLLGKKKLTL